MTGRNNAQDFAAARHAATLRKRTGNEQETTRGRGMDFRIKGRNALITGGSMGIGRATAVELSREGVNVAICARNAERAHAAAAEIEIGRAHV